MEHILEFSMNNWLENYKRRSIKPASFDRLKIAFRLMQKYSISKISLEDLRCSDIQLYLNDLMDNGYSYSTIKKQYTLLTSYLRFAYSEGMIQNPIYLNARLPIHEDNKDSEEIEAYTDYEQSLLMDELTTYDHPVYILAILMIECGLRIGEALALTWDDILWNRRALRIGKTVVHLAAERRTFVQNSAKSKTSSRTIPLSRTALAALTYLKENSDRTLRYIFADESGEPITYNTVRYYLKKVCKESGVRYTGTHILRHTFATNCYNRGCDVKILSKLLGHADVSITYNVYIHLFGDALEEMRRVVE